MKRSVVHKNKGMKTTDSVPPLRYWEDLRWKTASEYGTLEILAPQHRENEGEGLSDTGDESEILLRIAGYSWKKCPDLRAYYPGQGTVVPGKGELAWETLDIKTRTQIMLGYVKLFPHEVIVAEEAKCGFLVGQYAFPLERASVKKELTVPPEGNLRIALLDWPLPTIRIRGENREELSEASVKIAAAQGDEDVIIAARRRKETFEVDLIFRAGCEIDSEGAMGLLILPPGWNEELRSIKEMILAGAPLSGKLEQYEDWIHRLQERYLFTQENLDMILKIEIGKEFLNKLERK